MCSKLHANAVCHLVRLGLPCEPISRADRRLHTETWAGRHGARRPSAALWSPVAMQQRFRVFLSAVCGEFRRAREAVASDLRARGLEVKARRDSRQEGGADTTLRKLHDYSRVASGRSHARRGRGPAVHPPPARAAVGRGHVPPRPHTGAGSVVLACDSLAAPTGGRLG